ncbi:MAG: septum formation protein [Planctomycetota bacterium]|jgi:septum formation protein
MSSPPWGGRAEIHKPEVLGRTEGGPDPLAAYQYPCQGRRKSRSHRKGARNPLGDVPGTISEEYQGSLRPFGSTLFPLRNTPARNPHGSKLVAITGERETASMELFRGGNQSNQGPDPGPAQLVLASTSPYRRRLLERLGVEFDVASPDFEEGPILEHLRLEGLAPAQIVKALARGKALNIASTRPDAIVIGGDQMVALGDEILGKPMDAAGARAQLTSMAGKTHALLTAMAVVNLEGQVIEHLDSTLLTMGAHSSDAIAAYVELDNPIDCAGSYKIEEHGIALFERIQTEDATSIEGLSLLALGRILRSLGFSFP